MIVKWNVPAVGLVSMSMPDDRLVRFLHALHLLGFEATVEMSN